ncbi:MAG: serine/threonine-protein kinase, partial [Myxococcota bacterium]
MLPGTSYRIVRWIGEGGMGVVYEAEHVDLGRRVALKVLRADYSGDRDASDCFASEARAVCQVASGFVVQVYDFARLPDGRGVFTMELLSGRTLLSERGTGVIEPARAIGLLRQICKALAAAHDAGIIHRDVKPDNIAISSPPGSRDSLKLLDFGIHAIVNTRDGTADARPAGTPSYLAPEAVAGVPVGVAADLYSLGCVAYEMLAGRLPFEHELESHRLLAHLDEAPPPLSSVAPGVPRPLAEVVERCLAKEPGQRYEHARDLEAALCEAQIAAGLQTDWDDLPLPDVEPDRRERILRAMPDPIVHIAKRRGQVAMLFALAFVLALAGVFWPRTDDTHVSAVDGLVAEARSAAARAYFVYPPTDEPDLPTAYLRVLELEEHAAPGPSRAAELRSEFAATLARLGDRYWDEPGGKAFAIDYYAE